MLRSITLILLLTFQVGYTATPELFQEETFTAATFAEAVNHFVSLGEEAAVNELRGLSSDTFTDFKRGFRINERIGWMCRVLFDPKDTQPIREPGFGGLWLPYHTMPLANWPRYPVAFSGSTYFVLSEGYILGGAPEDPKAYIEYCRKNGVFRNMKVPIPTKAQALKDAAALRKSKAWKDIKWEDSGENWSYTMNEGWIWKFIQKQAEDIR